MIARAALGLVSGISALIAEASFSSTIGLGSIIVGMLVVVLFGGFSFREKKNGGWKDRYEQQEAIADQERVVAKQERAKAEALAERLDVEREARHHIKDELAATKAQLEIEKAKPDLSTILEQQRILWSEALNPLTDTLKALQETQEQMLTLLTPQT